MATEQSSLLERRRPNRPTYQTNDSFSSPLPSPTLEQAVFPNISSKNKDSKFKWFNKRTGYYDEDRQDLVKESTGVRVWSESYSSIGKEDKSRETNI
jgi:chloride channel 3/4/5